jgi:hypothetical protein
MGFQGVTVQGEKKPGQEDPLERKEEGLSDMRSYFSPTKLGIDTNQPIRYRQYIKTRSPSTIKRRVFRRYAPIILLDRVLFSKTINNYSIKSKSNPKIGRIAHSYQKNCLMKHSKTQERACG